MGRCITDDSRAAFLAARARLQTTTHNPQTTMTDFLRDFSPEPIRNTFSAWIEPHPFNTYGDDDTSRFLFRFRVEGADPIEGEWSCGSMVPLLNAEPTAQERMAYGRIPIHDKSLDAAALRRSMRRRWKPDAQDVLASLLSDHDYLLQSLEDGVVLSEWLIRELDSDYRSAIDAQTWTLARAPFLNRLFGSNIRQAVEAAQDF